MTDENRCSIAHVEDAVWVAAHSIGMSRYDFAFEQYFACRHPVILPQPVMTVARMGAANDYALRYAALREQNIVLIHTPEQYERTSYLPNWYPLLADLTPRSIWFDRRPTVQEIESAFRWPVFVKGARQTSKHQRKLSILEGPDAFTEVMDLWEQDPILWWQKIVCREFVSLRLVGRQSAHNLPRSFEFRTFWWRGECVGIGPYWMDEAYSLKETEKAALLSTAGEAARRISVRFLVVDIAQKTDGQWIVIEVNDGQDSGYAGVSPMLLWRRIIDIESKHTL